MKPEDWCELVRFRLISELLVVFEIDLLFVALSPPATTPPAVFNGLVPNANALAVVFEAAPAIQEKNCVSVGLLGIKQHHKFVCHDRKDMSCADRTVKHVGTNEPIMPVEQA